MQAITVARSCVASYQGTFFSCRGAGWKKGPSTHCLRMCQILLLFRYFSDTLGYCWWWAWFTGQLVACFFAPAKLWALFAWTCLVFLRKKNKTQQRKHLVGRCKRPDSLGSQTSLGHLLCNTSRDWLCCFCADYVRVEFISTTNCQGWIYLNNILKVEFISTINCQG